MRKKVEDYFRDGSLDKIRSLEAENGSLRIQLSEERERTLNTTIAMFRDRWDSALKCAGIGGMPQCYRFLDDPVHGQITVPDYAAHLLDHPIIRRLDFVKQLSFAYLRHRSAMHSRASHSLGVAALMSKALQNIWARGIAFDEKGPKAIDLPKGERSELLRVAFLSGLLHDIGHGPFGHALDRYVAYRNPSNPLPKPDKHLTVQYLDTYLKESLEGSGFDYGRLRRILDPKESRNLDGWDAFVAELLDSALDVDRMDYLVRDSRMTGLTAGTVNINALIERMVAYQEDGRVRLIYDKGALPYIENFLYARDIMFISCYESENKLAAERTLVKIVQKLVESKKVDIEQLMLLTDDELLHILFYKVPSSLNCDNLILSLKNGRNFSLADDLMLTKESERNAEIRSWVDARLGEQWTKALIEKPLEWEGHVARHAGLLDDQILLTVPSDECHPDKQIDARILVKDNGVFRPQRITDFSKNVSDIGEMLARNRQVIRLFVSPDLDSEAAKRAVVEFRKLLAG
jgi:HD superfamily phosphohydrolase